ncbi:MAG: cob(I)yrinic acid a,c-diamide adenosyltransferase [Planctomyces sp.]
MVRIDRIYTRTGDEGFTSTGDGQRVSKLSPGIIAGGTVDELNCAIGVAIAQTPDSQINPLLRQIQQTLFDLGADLCISWTPDLPPDDRCPRISEAHAATAENLIDKYAARQMPLKSFILPGGKNQAAWLHLARSICRRAEIDVLKFGQSAPVNPCVPVFLNRLSDLLFVLARTANDDGNSDILWKPDSGLPTTPTNQ